MSDVALDETLRRLPAGWRWAKLGECGEVVAGVTLGRRLDGKVTREVPYLRVANVKDGYLDLSDLAMTPATEVEILALTLKQGDLLLTEGGDPDKLGRGTIWEAQIPVCIHQNHIFRVRLDVANLVPGFVALQIGSRYGKDYFLRHAKQTTGIATINQQVLKAFPLMVPPVPEQRRIAAALREQMAVVDQAREAAEARLVAAKALTASYLRQAFPQSGDTLPTGWHWTKLGDVCDIKARQVDPKKPEFGVLPHINGENIESGSCRLLAVRSAAEDQMTSGKYLFEQDDVLYSKLRPYLRKVVVAPFRGVCSADMYPISCHRDALDPEYASRLLTTDAFTEYADAESRRARMPKLNRNQLFNWSFPLPPLAEQRRVVAVLNEQLAAADKVRQTAQDELDTINALPAALLRRAFNGEL